MRGTEMGYILHINGNPIGDIKKGFAAACERASLDDVTPPTLRHTAATWRMPSGVKTWEAAGFLAISEEVLIGAYGHHHPDHMRDAAEVTGTKFFRRISASCTHAYVTLSMVLNWNTRELCAFACNAAAWEATPLPLSYTRARTFLTRRIFREKRPLTQR